MVTHLTTMLLAKILLPIGQTNKVTLHEILFFVYEASSESIWQA